VSWAPPPTFLKERNDMLDIASTDTSQAVTPFWSTTKPAEFKRIKALFDDHIFKAKTLTSLVMRITPEMAAYIINHHNSRNRPVNPRRVIEYKEKIQQGRMKLHSQGISFATDGNINNGQHRLLGVIAAGEPCDFYVTFGEDVEAFDVIDTNKVRSAKDALYINGTPNGSAAATASRILLLWKRRDLTRVGVNHRIDNDEIVDFVNANPSLLSCLQMGDRIRFKLGGSPAPLGAAIFLIKQNSKNAGRLDEFVTHLLDGANLAQSSPILRLRDGLQSGKISGEVRSNTGRNANVVAHFINAWNKWTTGKTGSIRWQKSEDFPEIL
jgi:hypothetical protein